MSDKTLLWLDNILLEKILQKCDLENTVEIFDFEAEPAINKGDNFMSNMQRVRLRYFSRKNGCDEVKTKTFIFKLMPTLTEEHTKQMEMSGAYDTEFSMYSSTLNEMSEILKNEYRLEAKGYYLQETEPMLLVIENLKSSNFLMTDRVVGLDLTHAIRAVQGLARFHGASVRLCEQKPALKNIYDKGFFSKNKITDCPLAVEYAENSLKILADEIATWPEVEKNYSEKILKLVPKIYDLGIEVLKPRDGEFNVINHGDYWVNNMMFKYNNSSQIIDHVMIDFQFCNYSSPAIDLVYFCISSLSDHVSQNHKDEIIQNYLKTLCDTMEGIGCETCPPSLEKLYQLLDEYMLYEMVTAFVILPVILADREKSQSIDELVVQDAKPTGYSCLRYRKIMTRCLQIYDKKGLLDL